MRLPSTLVPFLLALAVSHGRSIAADHNAAVEAALKPAAKWPGVIKSYIGVTRLGTRIPCLVTKDDVDYGTKKKRILLVGGLDGSKLSVESTLASMEWFLTSKDAAEYRKTTAISAVPIANPDGWATKNGPGNLSGGFPAKAFPPKGPFYSTKTEPEAAYLWRWIGMHAPDYVYVFENRASKSSLEPLKWHRVVNVGPVWVEPHSLGDSPRSTLRYFKLRLEVRLRLDVVRKLRHDLTERVKKTGGVPHRKLLQPRKDFASRQAKAELQRRIARTPTQVAKQLAKRYGHNLKSVVYIPAVALIGRVRLGELTGDASHLKDIERIVAPYVTGRKDSLGRRVSGSHLSGHLIFAELARATKDRAKRKRYVALVRRAADLGFDRDGKPKRAMPYHSEMSDSVFMGCPILVAAGKLTGETKYYDMALRHMRFMLKLNLRADGLHRHSPLNETAWGRGNGFPALGLALCLTDLPADQPGRKEMLAAFQNHMAAMAKHQDYTGTWHQVVDHPESYRELTVTCMTTFAMVRGIRNGWLDAKTYTPIVKRAWTAIKTRVAPDATLVDVCTGTGKQRSLRAYYDRPAILGYDARGGAMALLVATEMAAWEKEKNGTTSEKTKAVDPLAAPRGMLHRFLRAFADADTKAMKKFYAPTVTVGRGSSLLNPKYGGLSDGKSQDKDVVVKRDQLLQAYEKAIVAFGGMKDWKQRGAKLLKNHLKDIRFVTITKQLLLMLKAKKVKIDLKEGDILAIVIPKGDSLTYFLQKNKDGKWRIVGEHWD